MVVPLAGLLLLAHAEDRGPPGPGPNGLAVRPGAQRCLQQAAEAEARKRRDETDLDLAEEDLPAHHAHLK